MIVNKHLAATLLLSLFMIPAPLLACDMVKQNIESALTYLGEIADEDALAALRSVTNCNASWEICSFFDNAAYQAGHHLTHALTSMIETDVRGQKCNRCSRAQLDQIMRLAGAVDYVNARLNEKYMNRGQLMPNNWEYLAKLPSCGRIVLPPPIEITTFDDPPPPLLPSNPQGPNWDAGCTSRQFRKGGATHRYTLWGDPTYGDLWLICSDRDDALWIKHNSHGGWERVTRRISHGGSKKNDANCFTTPEITTEKQTLGGRSLCIVNP